MTVWVQHLQTGLGIFARLLIGKNQTCETDSLCFFSFSFSLCFWSAPLLITWQGHRRRLSGLIHGLPAAVFFRLFLREQSAAALCTAAGSLSESRAAGVTLRLHSAGCLSVHLSVSV